MLEKIGILSQTQNATKLSEIARVEEEANLSLTASAIDNRTSGQAVKGIGTILSELKAEGKIEDYGTTENTDITNIKFDVNSITLGAGDNKELTVTFESGSVNGGYYVQIKGKKYSVSKVNDKIEIGKTEITTSGILKREIRSVGTSNSAIATVQILETEKDIIKITGVSGGTEGIASATIIVKYTENTTATITVNVKSKYTVNLYESSTATSATAITVLQGEKASDATGYALPTAPDGKKFNKWVLKTAVGENEGQQIGDEATSLLNNVTQDLEVYADFKDKPIAFRTYGEPLNAGTYGDGYRFTSTDETIKVDINDTPNNTTDDIEVADNWRIFYEDEDFLYLIYEDYYPVESQTRSGTSGLKFANVWLDNKPYAIGTDNESQGYKIKLLKYLRNNSGYGYNTGYGSLRYDSFSSDGTEYLSWSKLKDAISGLSKMNEKTISVQGAPDIDLWVTSWNAKGNTKLKTTRGTRGYNIMKSTLSSNSKYFINVKTDNEYNTTSIEMNKTGYYDALYFPYTSYTQGDGTSGNATSYWLASPGDYNDSSRLCCVDCYGNIYCYAHHYYNFERSARPVIAIEK